MARNPKTLEQQLAEALDKKQKAAVRIDQLEARRKVRDARRRAWGEKVLIGAVLNAAATQADFKATLEGLVAAAGLKPAEREAALWLLDGVEPKKPPSPNGSPALPAGNGDGSGRLETGGP
jgi:hypothetical protein